MKLKKAIGYTYLGICFILFISICFGGNQVFSFLQIDTAPRYLNSHNFLPIGLFGISMFIGAMISFAIGTLVLFGSWAGLIYFSEWIFSDKT